MSGQRNESLLIDDMIGAVRRLLELGPQIPAHGEPERHVAEGMLWSLTVLGEASKRVPADLRARFEDVNWRGLARTRDLVVHRYEGVDWEVIAGIVTENLPDMLPRLLEVRDVLREQAP